MCANPDHIADYTVSRLGLTVVTGCKQANRVHELGKGKSAQSRWWEVPAIASGILVRPRDALT